MFKVVMVSGGFDPLHPGHLEFFRRACTYGDRLWVVVDSDEFVAKKHSVMLSAEQRGKLLLGLRDVDDVIVSEGPDVCETLRRYEPHVYCVGADHADLSFPERAVCEELGIDLVVIKDTPRMSSTELISRVQWSSRNLPVTVSLLKKEGAHGVLIGKSRHGWCLPGGFVESGESLEDALWREVKEETGLYLGCPEYFSSTPGTYHDGRRVLAVYYVSNPFGEPVKTEELTDYRTISSPEKLSTDCDTLAVEAFFKRYR